MHTNTTVAVNPNFMSSFLLCAVFLEICICFNHSQNFKSSFLKTQKIFFSYFC